MRRVRIRMQRHRSDVSATSARILVCVAAVLCAPVAAQEYSPDTPPEPVPNPDGSVTAGELARGAIDVPGDPIHDNELRTFGSADRLEYQSNDGEPKYVWDVFGYAGGDYNRLWIESEGEGLFDGDTESADLQVLYNRAITPYWNLQLGWRHTFEPDATDFLVIAAEGLDFFWSSVEADLYVSEDGDVSGALELEYDEPITQRLFLQPRFETNFQFQDVEAQGLGAGINDYELGLRLRYEIRREFAPYVGISWAQTVFETADLLPDDEDAGTLSAVAGVRVWF